MKFNKGDKALFLLSGDNNILDVESSKVDEDKTSVLCSWIGTVYDKDNKPFRKKIEAWVSEGTLELVK